MKRIILTALLCVMGISLIAACTANDKSKVTFPDDCFVKDYSEEEITLISAMYSNFAGKRKGGELIREPRTPVEIGSAKVSDIIFELKEDGTVYVDGEEVYIQNINLITRPELEEMLHLFYSEWSEDPIVKINFTDNKGEQVQFGIALADDVYITAGEHYTARGLYSTVPCE